MLGLRPKAQSMNRDRGSAAKRDRGDGGGAGCKHDMAPHHYETQLFRKLQLGIDLAE